MKKSENDKKLKLLICSLLVPYDSVAHAGGQTHNYYVKRLKKETSIDIHLVTFANSSEKPLVDLNKHGISNSVIYLGNQNIPNRIIRKTITKVNKYFPKTNYWGFFSGFQKYLLLKELKKLKKYGYAPDIIELNWTQIAFFFPLIKKIFPSAKYYAVEQDVSFLRYERLYMLENDKHKRNIEKLKYDMIKKNEISVLRNFDKVFVFNEKDKKLLLENGIQDSLVMVLVPYFKNFSFPLTAEKRNMILFYGAMARKENHMAAIWFIEKVFPLLDDTNFVFIVLGSNPHLELLEYQNDRIIITGYQSDVQMYFEKALCLVAPLELGAGIKIKVLEALSAGIPVLGTEVASEGINVTQGIDFFYCKMPSEYVETIKALYNNIGLKMSVGLAARELTNKNYNFDESFQQYVGILHSMAKQ